MHILIEDCSYAGTAQPIHWALPVVLVKVFTGGPGIGIYAGLSLRSWRRSVRWSVPVVLV